MQDIQAEKRPIPNSMYKQKVRELFTHISRRDMDNYIATAQEICRKEGYSSSKTAMTRRELIELFKATGTPKEFIKEED